MSITSKQLWSQSNLKSVWPILVALMIKFLSHHKQCQQDRDVMSQTKIGFFVCLGIPLLQEYQLLERGEALSGQDRPPPKIYYCINRNQVRQIIYFL